MAFIPFEAQQSAGFQIVATITSENVGLCPELARAGATSFRLNASHMGPRELARTAKVLRSSLPEAPIVIDLQGAKMRLGMFQERPVKEDERLRFSLWGESGDLPLPHPELYASVKPGETLGCDDDRLHFRVERTGDGMVEAVALQAGTLKPRKGVNVVEHPVELKDLTHADAARIDAVKALPGLTWAFSFMKDGAEAGWIRRRVENAKVIGKIEREESVANLARIAESVDAIWICRGDLGAQLGTVRLAALVAKLEPLAYRRPVLIAGQVLEHLTEHPEPTRSEVCHLHDLVTRGWAGMVLSDETAVGKRPVRAVDTAANLAVEFRKLTPARR